MSEPWFDEYVDIKARFDALRGAVMDVYFAAHWSPDRACPANELWEKLRDAAEITPGNSPKYPTIISKLWPGDYQLPG